MRFKYKILFRNQKINIKTQLPKLNLLCFYWSKIRYNKLNKLVNNLIVGQ